MRRIVGLMVAAVAVVACGSNTPGPPAADPTSTSTATGVDVGPYLRDPATGRPDHWHAAVGVNVCGTWQPGPFWPQVTDAGVLSRAAQPQVYAGLHTHTGATGQSDGLIHMEPASADDAGANATVGRWLDYGGWTVTSTSLSLWNGADGKPIVEHNGDACPDGPGVVRWALGSHAGAGVHVALVEQHTDVNAYKLFDGDVIAIYFVPDSTALAPLGQPPSVDNLQQPSAGEGAGHVNLTTTSAP